MSMPRQWKPLKRHPGIYEYETKRGKKYGIRRSYTDINHKYRTWSKSGFITWRDADIELKKIRSNAWNWANHRINFRHNYASSLL